MTEALLTAAHSQLIDPAFIKKLAAVKDSLEVVAVKIKTYKENNKEHGTKQLKRRAIFRWSRPTDSLDTWVKFWTWSVLSYDGAVLSGGLNPQWIIILGALQHMG